MKSIIWVILLVGSMVVSQDYQRVDAVLGLYPEQVESPEELARFIARDFNTQEDQVRAVYSWIIQHIAYNPDEYKKFDYSFKTYRERNEKEEKNRRKIISRTLHKRVAVCEGYAFLFEKLCTLLGINNYLVRGDTKTNFDDIGRPFARNHMWNIAFLNGKPYLFDPTWGAGKYNGKFIKDTTYFFFKTPPKQFVKSHYPDMFEDALLLENISKETFSLLPLILDKKILPEDIIFPKKGLLAEEEYLGEIVFSIKTRNPESIHYSYDGSQLTPIEFDFSNEVLTFTIPLVLGGEKLLIYFDHQPALGYRVE